jgi:CRISPR-associated protein Cas1
MWWLTDPQDLHRVSDRLSTVYVERCHVDRDQNAVVLINRERTVRVPAAMVAALLLGPGTRVTHAAVRLLADSGTAVCWVGEQGVRMYAAGLGPSRGSTLILKQAYLVSRTNERLAVARRMYAMRFPDEDVAGLTMQQLRGREGARVKKIYRAHSARTGVPWTGREYKPGQPFDAGNDVNRLLSAGHSCLYGICHAAIVGLGASPALGFCPHRWGDLFRPRHRRPLQGRLHDPARIRPRRARPRLRAGRPYRVPGPGSRRKADGNRCPGCQGVAVVRRRRPG